MAWAELLGAGIGALGAGLSSSSADKARKETAALTREMAMKGIQYRVNDAKKAGIHPLYALGASSAISPTLPAGGDVSGLNQAAANIGNMGKSKTDQLNRRLIEANIANVEAQTAKTTIEGQNLARQGSRVDLQPFDPSPYINRANRRHTDTISDIERKTGVQYLTKPGLTRLSVGNGQTITVPNQDYLDPGELVGAAVAGGYGEVGDRTWRSSWPFLREYKLPNRIKRRTLNSSPKQTRYRRGRNRR